MKHKTKLGFGWLLCLLIVLPVLSQEKNPQPVLGVTGNCEDAKARLDNVYNLVGKGGIIILIARLGNGENSRKVNRQRLHYIERYLNRGNEFD